MGFLVNVLSLIAAGCGVLVSLLLSLALSGSGVKSLQFFGGKGERHRQHIRRRIRIRRRVLPMLLLLCCRPTAKFGVMGRSRGFNCKPSPNALPRASFTYGWWFSLPAARLYFPSALALGCRPPGSSCADVSTKGAVALSLSLSALLLVMLSLACGRSRCAFSRLRCLRSS